MNNNYSKTIFSLCIALIFVLTQCKKKEKEIEIIPKGSFTYMGNIYDISSKGILIHGGPGDVNGTYIQYLSLFSKDFKFINIDKISGFGPLINTTFASPEQDNLGAGTYVYRPSSSVFSCGSGFYATQYNGDQDTGNFMEFSNGTYTVSTENVDNQKVYNIQFNLKDSSGATIVGSYSGTLIRNN